MMDNIKLDHKITYNDPNLFEKFDAIKEKEEQEQFRNVIYNYDLLMIFNLQDFLEELINEKVKQLYKIMITNFEFRKFIMDLTNNINYDNENTITCFMMLFSYDSLYLFYPCICEFFEKGSVSIDKLEAIKNNIF
jgi:hypothetical protein